MEYIDYDDTIKDTFEAIFKDHKEYDGNIVFINDPEYIKKIDWKKVLSDSKEIKNSYRVLRSLNQERIAGLSKVFTVDNEGVAKIKEFRKMGLSCNFYIVPHSLKKSDVVNAYHNVLVDDSIKNLDDWSMAGGVPIFFSKNGKNIDGYGKVNSKYLMTDSLDILYKLYKVNGVIKEDNDLERIKLTSLRERDNGEGDYLLNLSGKELYYHEEMVYEGKKCLKDLLRIIDIKNAEDVLYQEYNLLVPRVYAEGLKPILPHRSCQCIMLYRITNDSLNIIRNYIDNTLYGKTEYDKPWIGKIDSYNNLKEGDMIYIMNRRVGGWDGSKDRPVIELLSAGGHIPSIYNLETGVFETMDEISLLRKEILEEMKIDISEKDISILGGFHNKISNELVTLGITELSQEQLREVLDKAKGNISENIDGVYLGIFEEVIKIYQNNPSWFAGGEASLDSNFTSNEKLVKKIKEYK